MRRKIIDICIDLETAALTPNAAILSIAAVPFGFDYDESDPMSVYRPRLFTGREVKVKPFYRVVNANSCICFGFDFDAETVQWWSHQSEEAKQQILAPEMLHIADCMHQFIAWCNDIRDTYGAELRVWAQGLDFDMPILRNAVIKTCPGEMLPWQYYDQRDSRTFLLTNLARLTAEPESKELYDFIPAAPRSGDIKRSALCDAMQTAWNIVTTYRETPILCEAFTSREDTTTDPSTSAATPK